MPYTGTHVIQLSVADVREIHSMRTTLERFAFEQAWPRRDASFRKEMQRRHLALTRTIDRKDDLASIAAELELHSMVYEASGHQRGATQTESFLAARFAQASQASQTATSQEA